jgi:hypothetical protein
MPLTFVHEEPVLGSVLFKFLWQIRSVARCLIFTTLSRFSRNIHTWNMIRKLSLLLAAVWCCTLTAEAQHCGFDAAHRNRMVTDASYAARVQAMNTQLAALANSPQALIVNSANGPVYEIPVVIHVLHTGGLPGTMYNPTDAQLTGLVNYLTQSYEATYGSYPGPSSGGTYFPIRFVLAKRDTSGNATTGIEHINAVSTLNARYPTLGVGTRYGLSGVRMPGSVNSGVYEDTVKAVSNWNPHDYYNIWIVNKIDSNDGTFGTFVAGYAYFPGASHEIDGTMMLATSSGAPSSTIVHEMGHAFSLYHTFEGDDPGFTGAATTCPSNTNCNIDGDMVCDTEPMKRSLFNCPSTNSCTGNPWTNNTQHNFMDYSNCKDRFTPGQKTRLINSLLTDRASLITSIGGVSASVANPVSASCLPTMPSPPGATYDAGVSLTEISDLSGNLKMAASSDGGYDFDGKRYYFDRARTQRANLVGGNSYSLSVTTGINREYVRVYIDYDNNGVFNTTNELVYSDNGSLGTPYETHTGTITVPATGITTCTPLRMRVITDRNTSGVSAPGPCAALVYGQAEDYSVYIQPASSATFALTQTTGTNPSCNGSNLGFTASYSGVSSSPSVRIYVNSTLKAVGTSYSSSTFANGDTVWAKLNFNNACGNPDSLVSNQIIINRATTVAPTVSIQQTTGTNPGCAGQSITLKAVPTNGGTAPAYQWYRNNSLQTGTSGDSLALTPGCTDSFYVVLTSNSACASPATATSNTFHFSCGAQAVSVSLAITGGSNPTCSGRPVTFTATPGGGGTAPSYQWYINNALVTGVSGATFTTSLLNNNDSVYVILTSNSPCASVSTARSAAIHMTVVPTITPSVTKAITIGSNPDCAGDTIGFSATAANAGPTPSYQWFQSYNGVASIIPGQTSSTLLATSGIADQVSIWVRVIVSNASGSCYTKDTVYSDTTLIVRTPMPRAPMIHFIGHQLVCDSPNVQWWGPAGIIPGATGPTYTPTVQGEYFAMLSTTCTRGAKSNVLTVSPLSIGGYDMSQVRIFPNPTSGQVTISWSKASTARIVVYNAAGQEIMNDFATLATSRSLDLSALPSGMYFLMLQDDTGKTGVTPLRLTR